eukprot:GGOE01018305.1.p1 GENE.GGOE01018305.1~~GGOE01018305.1.p1  ORF type:complete len:413 (+),score=52.78 GGOE01018305.1:34-1272(+)
MKREGCFSFLVFAVIVLQSLLRQGSSDEVTKRRPNLSRAPAEPVDNGSLAIQECHKPNLPRHKLLIQYRVYNLSTAKCKNISICPTFTRCLPSWSLCLQREPDGMVVVQFTDVLLSSQGHVFALLGQSRATLFGIGGCAEKIPLTMSTAAPICIPRAISIVCPYGTNFFHFMTDSLPRLVQLRAVLQVNPHVLVLTNSAQHIYLVDLLLGWRNLAFRMVSGKTEAVFAKQLMVPLVPPCSAGPHPLVSVIRQRYVERLQQEKHHAAPSFITFVSRTGTRRVDNEAELLHELRVVYGPGLVHRIEGLHPGNVNSTLAVLAQTRVLIGPHGAGLTMLMFLPPKGSAVVELRPLFIGARKGILSFVHLATHAGIPIHVVQCKGSFFSTIHTNVTAMVLIIGSVYLSAVTKQRPFQ